jgi:desulfoferrodoxin (superoxide reductase-like protein)
MTSDCTLDKEITFGGIKVSVIHKEDQVIYKLADGLKVTTVNDKQRQDILNEIRARYIKDSNLLIDDPNEPSILVRVKENRHEKHVNSLEIPLKRSVIEIEEDSGEVQHPKQDNAKESSLKATQKYIKTGNYSKKKNKNQKQQLKQNLESRVQKNATLQQHQPQLLQSLFGTTPHALSLVLSSEEQAQNNKEIKKR